MHLLGPLPPRNSPSAPVGEQHPLYVNGKDLHPDQRLSTKAEKDLSRGVGRKKTYAPVSQESVIWGRKQEASGESLRSKGMQLVVGEGSRKGSQPPGGRFRPTVSRLCPMGQILSTTYFCKEHWVCIMYGCFHTTELGFAETNVFTTFFYKKKNQPLV